MSVTLIAKARDLKCTDCHISSHAEEVDPRIMRQKDEMKHGEHRVLEVPVSHGTQPAKQLREIP